MTTAGVDIAGKFVGPLVSGFPYFLHPECSDSRYALFKFVGTLFNVALVSSMSDCQPSRSNLLVMIL